MTRVCGGGILNANITPYIEMQIYIVETQYTNIAVENEVNAQYHSARQQGANSIARTVWDRRVK